MVSVLFIVTFYFHSLVIGETKDYAADHKQEPYKSPWTSESTESNPNNTFDPLPKKPSPCEQIVEACTKAGFVRSSTNSTDPQDLDNNCLNPILNGKRVKGIQISHSLGEQCLGSMPKHVKPTTKVHVVH